MEKTQLPGDANITGQVLLYDKPEPLNPEQHGKLKLRATDKPYAFVADQNIVPLTVIEFAPAALSYPIIFVGDGRAPVAVMGLSGGTNLFAGKDGAFEPDAYVPAYVRRYPFVFANDEQNQRLVVCIDRAGDLLTEDGQTPLFENGEPTEYTKNCITFLNDFETERRRTESFVDTLKRMDLLETRTTSFTPRNPDGSAGEPQPIAEYFAVSEEKLQKLSTEQFIELRDNGGLGQIYAHLISLIGWEKLIAKTLSRAQAEADLAAAPTAANA